VLSIRNHALNKVKHKNLFNPQNVSSFPSDDVTDDSLFNWPVQTNKADCFKLALCLVSDGLKGMMLALFIPSMTNS
jgi:hypothetical protein